VVNLASRDFRCAEIVLLKPRRFPGSRTVNTSSNPSFLRRFLRCFSRISFSGPPLSMVSMFCVLSTLCLSEVFFEPLPLPINEKKQEKKEAREKRSKRKEEREERGKRRKRRKREEKKEKKGKKKGKRRKKKEERREQEKRITVEIGQSTTCSINYGQTLASLWNIRMQLRS